MATTNQRLERLVRVGYATKGFVYGVMGAIATQAAFLSGGAVEGPTGALGRVQAQPFGRVLLAATAAGLAAYALWRLVQAALDPEDGSDGAKGALRRAGYAVSGLSYAGLAYAAGRGAFAEPVEGGSRSASSYLAGFPGAGALVLAAGLVVVGVGIAQFVRAYRTSFEDHFDRSGHSDRIRWIGRVGLAARGVVFVLVGGLLVRSGGAATGTEEALEYLVRQAPWAFAVEAVGLLVYAAFCFVEAKHRRIRVPSSPF